MGLGGVSVAQGAIMGSAGGDDLKRESFSGAGAGDRGATCGFVDSESLEDGVSGVQLAQPFTDPRTAARRR